MNVTNEGYEFNEIMLPMRDGVKLLTRICMPQPAAGPVPVLITRTPYDHFELYDKSRCEEHVRHGYASVHQQCRGTFGSEGEWVPNEHERQDGIDTVNWLDHQAWCESIGVYGDSYTGLTGWLIADALPAKAKALYLMHYSVDRYISAYKQGLFRHDVLTSWAMGNSGQEIQADYLQSARFRPHINVDEKLWGIQLEWYRKWITNTDDDAEYWNSGVWKTLKEIPPKINIPVCVVAGWYDHHLEGTLLGYATLSDETKAKSKLVVGGWNHFRSSCVPAHRPAHNIIDFEAHLMRWFNRILKEHQEPEAGVEVYAIGDDQWLEPVCWPMRTTCTRHLYLLAHRQTDCQAWKLEQDKQPESSTIAYPYDPENPVGTKGSESMLATVDEIGSQLQQEPGYREDVISFVSDTLTAHIRIGGQMNVKLYVSSDCDDTCFTAKVMEVLPNGEAYHIRSSLSTLAYRHNTGTRLHYQPGEVVEINIDLLPVIWNIKAGSRVRVDISSSSFPEYSIHANYAGVWSLQDQTRIAFQQIHLGGSYPSALEIPILSGE